MQKTMIPPIQQLLIHVQVEASCASTIGAVESTPAFEKEGTLLGSTAIITFTEEKKMIQVIKPYNHTQQLCNSCKLQNDDPTACSGHEVLARRASTAHSQSLRGV